MLPVACRGKNGNGPAALQKAPSKQVSWIRRGFGPSHAGRRQHPERKGNTTILPGAIFNSIYCEFTTAGTFMRRGPHTLLELYYGGLFPAPSLAI
jgi:hypothetical protein